MGNIEFAVKSAPAVLPVLLLALSFIVKMSIERSVDLPKAYQSLIELPTDMMFLSSSLIVGFIISNPAKSIYGLLLLLACILISMLVIFLWRKAEHLFDKRSNWSGLLTVLGFLISVPAVVFTVNLNIPEGM